jgi:hypothetical protein
MVLQPGRYIGHFLGLASDGKPIYAAYCCVPDQQQDSDLPSFVSVSESTSDLGSWASYPPSSYPDSGGSAPGGGGGGGVPCTDCLSRLCVVRDETGRIVDIYYYTDDGDYVRVPDCGYYGSSPSSDSGSGNGGGGGNGECCPPDGSWYVLDYDLEILGDTISGTSDPKQWSDNTITWNNGVTGIPDCVEGASFTCILGSLTGGYVLHCNWYQCALDTDDFDITVTGCPELPTFYITIKPGRCASGSFVLRPA